MPAWPLRPARKPSNCLLGVVLFDDGVADVRAVEAGEEDAGFAQAEAGEDLVPRRLVGGGGQRDARDGRVALVQGRELQVLGPEVVAPLRDAMRFVDGEQGQLAGFVERIEHGQRAVEQQALGGDVDEVEVAAEDRLLDGLRRAPVERRVEDRRP